MEENTKEILQSLPDVVERLHRAEAEEERLAERLRWVEEILHEAARGYSVKDRARVYFAANR